MTASVNPITGEILVPRLDMPVVQVSPEIRELDVDAWRLELHDLADDVDMRPWPKMFEHNSEYIISGITYVRAFRIIPPYYVTFEDGQYSVRLKGGNNNILDVKTANQVSLLTQNSAGKTNDGLSATDADLIAIRIWATLISSLTDGATIGGFLVKRLLTKAFFAGKK